jgi:hypothetical protein
VCRTARGFGRHSQQEADGGGVATRPATPRRDGEVEGGGGGGGSASWNGRRVCLPLYANCTFELDDPGPF